MDYAVLKTELTDDPLTRGYTGMTDAEVVVDLNTKYCKRNRPSISGDEAFTATVANEFATLTDHKRILWVSWCGKDTIDPFGAANVAFVNWLFGEGSGTIVALNAIRLEAISRAAELGLGVVNEGHVQTARK
ncbi:MAG TPA: hypothetical protein VM243_11925 [Phycisphaerae bacterium]|nr:hypothetical protein [Phycisphaerae bacterium]